MLRTLRQKRQFLRSTALSIIVLTALISGTGSSFFEYILSAFAETHLLPPEVVYLLSGFAPLIGCLILIGWTWYQFVRLLLIAEEILLENIDHPEAQRKPWSPHFSRVPRGNDLIEYLSLQEHSPPSLV